MKSAKWLMSCLLLLLLLSACSPLAAAQTATPTPAPTEVPQAAPQTGDQPDAVRVAVEMLAQQLNVDEQDIQVIKAVQVEWPDSCLGVQLEDVMCAMVITPGYQVVLENQGKTYEFHTNEDASSVQPAPAAEGLVLSWHREGGIAGFCDDLAVYQTGAVSATSCKGEQPSDPGSASLSPEQLEQLNAWIDEFQSFRFEQSDDAVADAMTIRLIFNGSGDRAVADTDQQAMLDFANEIYNQAARSR